MSKKDLISIDVKELKTFLNHIIENNRFLQSQNKPVTSVEVIGESGIGKTSSIVQLAQELNMDFVKLNLAQIEEIGDLVGFPVKQYEVASEKETTWVDENLLPEYLKSGYKPTGQKHMSYAAPEWISGKTNGGILLLDDWNRADMRFIQAVMELVDRQQYISWKLPKDWHIILTANPDTGDYLVNSIDPAQKTRFISVNLKFNIDCWAEWAENEKMDDRCINFLLMHPELVNQEVNSRSISMFFNSISSINKFEESLPLIQMVGEGSVGSEFSSLFTMFINNKLDKMITPKNVFEKEEKYVVDTLKGLVKNESKYRADIASTLATRIVNYLAVYSKEKTVEKSIVERLASIVKAEVFTVDICYNMIKNIYNSNPAQFKIITLNKDLVKYILQ